MDWLNSVCGDLARLFWQILPLFAIVLLLFILLYYYLENGGIIRLNQKFSARRYVFPKSDELCKYLAEKMLVICKDTLNGDVLPQYPFLHGDHRSLRKRLIMFFYDRNDPERGPIAFHCPFVVPYKKELILHAGLVMVCPEYQKKGLQGLTAYNVALYGLLRLKSVMIITEIAASSSYLSVQKRFGFNYYPSVERPHMEPDLWHLDVANYMLAKYRAEFGCSKNGELDENTLVVKRSNEKSGGGAYQLIQTVESRRSKSRENETFLQSRLDNEAGDEQFYVARFRPISAVIKMFKK